MSDATKHGLQEPWRHLPGYATDIGAGGGKVWIVGKGSESSDFGVFRWDEMNASWVQEPTGTAGKLESPAGMEGPAGGILSGMLGEARPQAPAPGSSGERPSLGENSSVSADGHGRPWVTDETKRTYRLNGLVWEVLPGENTDIDLCGDAAWGIGTWPSDVGGCSLYRWDEAGRTWHRDPTAYGVRIAVDDRGMPWHVNARNELYRGISPSVTHVGGAGRDIGAGGGAVWMIGTNAGPGGFGVWVWDEESSRWLQDATGAGTRIAVDGRGLPWVVDSRGNIFRKG